MKVVLNDVKTGKAYQKEFDSSLFSGRKIGDKIEGNTLGFADYEFEITGGSDNAGFPHRKDVGSVRKKGLFSKGVGMKKKLRKGCKIRKTVAGNTFNDDTSQVSLKVLKYGKGPLGEEKKEEGAEVKPEAPKEEKPKKEEKVV